MRAFLCGGCFATRLTHARGIPTASRGLSSAAAQPAVAASPPLLFPGGEPDAPSVKTKIPGPRSLEQQRELGAFQDAAGVKFFGALWVARGRRGKSFQRSHAFAQVSRSPSQSTSPPAVGTTWWTRTARVAAPGWWPAAQACARSHSRPRQHTARRVQPHRVAAHRLQQPAHAGGVHGALPPPRASRRVPTRAPRFRRAPPRTPPTCRCWRTAPRWATRRRWGGPSGCATRSSPSPRPASTTSRP